MGSLLVSCVLTSYKKHFWFDELLTNILVSDSNLFHMLRALKDQVDTSPPLYYICAWFWSQLFGAGELSLRMFSSICIAGAFYITFRILRSIYGNYAALWSSLAAFMLSKLIREQVAEARNYGLFLLLCATAFYLFLKLSDPSCKSRRKLLVINCVVHGGLVLCHNYGILTSGSILFGMGLVGFRKQKMDYSAAFSVILGWLPFLLWLPALANQAKIGAEKLWIPRPTLDTLFDGLQGGIYTGLVFLFIAMLFVFKYPWNDTPSQSDRAVADEKTVDAESLVVVFALSLFLVPVSAFGLSFVFKPIFYSRYLIPITLSYAALFALLFQRVLEPAPQRTAPASRDLFPLVNAMQRACGMAIMAFLILYRPVQALYHTPLSGIAISDKTFSAFDAPVVFESGSEYLHMRRYSDNPSRYFLVQDWQTALASTNITTTAGYKILSAIKRNYPENQIYESADFLRQYDRFLVFDSEELLWAKRNLESNEEFSVTLAGRVGDRRLLLCERKKQTK